MRISRCCFNPNIGYKSQNTSMIDGKIEEYKSNRPDKNSKFKTAACITGLALLTILGIKYRKSVSNLFKSNPIADKGKPPTGKNATCPVTESFEPEWLFGLKRKEKDFRIKQTINITQDGQPYKKGNQQAKKVDMFSSMGGSSNHGPNWGAGQSTVRNPINEAIDTAVDFAIFEDIMTGGNEIKSAFSHIRNGFKGSADIAQEAPTGSIIEDALSSAGESVSGFADDIIHSAGDIVDSIGDALGNIGDIL